MDFIYVILILSVVFFSLHLTNGNPKFKPYLYVVSTLFGIFSIVVFCVLAVDVVRGLADKSACIHNIILSFDPKSADGRYSSRRNGYYKCIEMDFSGNNLSLYYSNTNLYRTL